MLAHIKICEGKHDEERPTFDANDMQDDSIMKKIMGKQS